MIEGTIDKYEDPDTDDIVSIPKYCDKCGKKLRQVLIDWKYNKDDGEKYIDGFYLVCPNWNIDDDFHYIKSLQLEKEDDENYYVVNAVYGEEKREERKKVEVALGVKEEIAVTTKENTYSYSIKLLTGNKVKFASEERISTILGAWVVWIICLLLWNYCSFSTNGEEINPNLIPVCWWPTIVFFVTTGIFFFDWKFQIKKERKVKKKKRKIPRLFRFSIYWALLSLLFKFVKNIEEIIIFLVNKYL